VLREGRVRLLLDPVDVTGRDDKVGYIAVRRMSECDGECALLGRR